MTLPAPASHEALIEAKARLVRFMNWSLSLKDTDAEDRLRADLNVVLAALQSAEQERDALENLLSAAASEREAAWTLAESAEAALLLAQQRAEGVERYRIALMKIAAFDHSDQMKGDIARADLSPTKPEEGL